KEFEALQTRAEGEMTSLRSENHILDSDLKSANEKYEVLRRMSERTLSQELSGLIRSIRRNLEHDLSEILFPLEGLDSRKEYDVVLRRVEVIRKYLGGLEDKK